MADEEPTAEEPTADEPVTHSGDADEVEPRESRPPIVIPKTTRLAMGAVVIIVGLIMLITGAAALKIIGVVLIAAGVFDLVVGQRQKV